MAPCAFKQKLLQQGLEEILIARRQQRRQYLTIKENDQKLTFISKAPSRLA